ncbi:hypothetical protein HDK77DRAFT_150229 [Phyllosticta capitalensis]|uniref:C2H2-type domain-containing protein n=1 Tax=Phyllosticta capitalensis TaxID=121624 RepID=A0ABR1YTZ7_9PEZI
MFAVESALPPAFSPPPPYLGSHTVEYSSPYFNLDFSAGSTTGGPNLESVFDAFECKRCDRMFVSRSAREQHWEDSSNHFICLAVHANGKRCTFDGENIEQLLQHYLVTHEFHSCRGCLQVFVDFKIYMKHLDEVFACSECQQHHKNENDVEQHMIMHRSRDIPCWGCSRPFPRACDVLYHLEGGYCHSGIDSFHLNSIAASFYPSWAYIDPAYREDLRLGVDLSKHYSRENPLPFLCPGLGCGNKFAKFHALVQHVEMGSCPASAEEGIIARVLEWMEHKVAMIGKDSLI